MKVDLRVERIKRGYSLDALSEEIGVPKTTLARVEKGGPRPRPEVAFKIASFFELEVTDIWELEAAA
jgi:DNA-binding XRE family transcriptional regulator